MKTASQALQLGPQSQAFFDRAQAVMPYGVSSNYRFYAKTITPVVADAKGGHIYDFDGRRYIDYRLGWGPVILGHGHPFVNERVKEAIDHGVSFAATQKYEVSVAERIIDLCPGVEMVRLANTGSECTTPSVWHAATRGAISFLNLKAPIMAHTTPFFGQPLGHGSIR